MSYFKAEAITLAVKFNPTRQSSLCSLRILSGRSFFSSRVKILIVCALPSNPPRSHIHLSKAFSPLCPKGGCPMSCINPAIAHTSGITGKSGFSTFNL